MGVVNKTLKKVVRYVRLYICFCVWLDGSIDNGRDGYRFHGTRIPRNNPSEKDDTLLEPFPQDHTQVMRSEGFEPSLTDF